MRNITRLSGYIIAGALSLQFASCSSPSSAPETSSAGPDANAGIWKTVVVGPGSVPTPPPPSQSTQFELNQIEQRQGKMTPLERASVAYWDSSAVVRWNEIARDLVIRHNINPPMASRLYTLVSVAQYDASVATWDAKYRYNRSAPTVVDSRITMMASTTPQIPSYPSDHASVAGASAAVLRAMFPSEASRIDSLEAQHLDSRIVGGYNYPSDVSAGDSLGRAVASFVLNKAATDRSNEEWVGTMPKNDTSWYSAQVPPQPPLLPAWGDVACWVITDMNAVMPAPPPAWNSPAYLKDLQEVRQISDTRTQGQIDTAKFWADGSGTATPPGHWNQIACSAMMQKNWTTVRQARALALMNMAMMDAGVCCWKCKYKYWVIRPSEADTNIKTAVPLPNFPSYTSGHSSFSGSAARVLGYLFPEQKATFEGYAQAAAISRVYGGIHYRFDSDAGLISGQKIGDEAIARARTDGAD